MVNLYRVCDECHKPVSESEVNVVQNKNGKDYESYCPNCFASYDKIKSSSKNKK